MKEIHTREEIHDWFKAGDTDGNGVLSINEFFLWTLSNSATVHGATALKQAFVKYDKDGTGLLDAREFKSACQEMGFGSVAHEIFEDLDKDGSGAISYRELAKTLTETVPEHRATAQMLTALALNASKGRDADTAALNTKTWKIRGRDAESVRKELREEMQKANALVADVLQLFDMDATNENLIDDMEFYTAMRTKFGFKGHKHVIDEIFNSMDEDKSGHIGYDELFEFLQGYRHSMDMRSKRARAMRFTVPQGVASLADIHWDIETLRLSIKLMLKESGVGPDFMMKAWDKTGDGELNRGEFLKEVKNIVGDDKLWEDELQEVATNAYFEAAEGSGHHGNLFGGNLDMIELQHWISKPASRPSGKHYLTKSAAKAMRKETKRAEETKRPPSKPPSRRAASRSNATAAQASSSKSPDARPLSQPPAAAADAATTTATTASHGQQPQARLVPHTALSALRSPPTPRALVQSSTLSVGSSYGIGPKPALLASRAAALRSAALSPRVVQTGPVDRRRPIGPGRRMLTVTPLLDSLDALDPAYYPYMDGLDMAPKVLARHGPVPWGR